MLRTGGARLWNVDIDRLHLKARFGYKEITETRDFLIVKEREKTEPHEKNEQ